MRCLIAILLALLLLGGCGNPFVFDPATTVILKVQGIDDDAEQARVVENAKELVTERSTWHQVQTTRHNEIVMIKLSPVDDAKSFASRIKFGKVTAIDDNIIQLDVP